MPEKYISNYNGQQIDQGIANALKAYTLIASDFDIESPIIPLTEDQYDSILGCTDLHIDISNVPGYEDFSTHKGTAHYEYEDDSIICFSGTMLLDYSSEIKFYRFEIDKESEDKYIQIIPIEVVSANRDGYMASNNQLSQIRIQGSDYYVMPEVSSAVEGKILTVVDGKPEWVALPIYNGEVE